MVAGSRGSRDADFHGNGWNGGRSPPVCGAGRFRPKQSDRYDGADGERPDISCGCGGKYEGDGGKLRGRRGQQNRIREPAGTERTGNHGIGSFQSGKYLWAACRSGDSFTGHPGCAEPDYDIHEYGCRKSAGDFRD